MSCQQATDIVYRPTIEMDRLNPRVVPISTADSDRGIYFRSSRWQGRLRESNSVSNYGIGSNQTKHLNYGNKIKMMDYF